jgi:hypothetical protein
MPAAVPHILHNAGGGLSATTWYPYLRLNLASWPESKWSTFHAADTKIRALSVDGQYLDTILCNHASHDGRSMRLRQNGEDSAMCTEATTAPTLRGWLRDPMIRLVMESDDVTQHEMIALVRRVTAAAASRPESSLPSRWHAQEAQAVS